MSETAAEATQPTPETPDDGTITVAKNYTGDFYEVHVSIGGVPFKIADLPAGTVDQVIAESKQAS